MKIRDFGRNRFIVLKSMQAAELFCLLGDLDATVLKPVETQVLLDFRSELLEKANGKEQKIVSSIWRFSILKSVLQQYYKMHPLSDIIINKINSILKI